MGSGRGAFKADLLLLVTAMIWGFAFVAQRCGMAIIGPFAYSAARFALGALALVPLLVLSRRRAARKPAPYPALPLGRRLAWAGLAGLVLFAGANFQQVGLVYTTAANSGFITSLYVILVPLMGICFGRHTTLRVWLSALLALAGLYILSVGGGFRMAPGDLLVLVGAFFWAGHILVINHLVARMDSLEIAVGQFATCALLSLAAALLREPAPFANLVPAAWPILYGGLMSIGIAYTLQIVAQRTAPPTHASIILSMEAFFAALGGVLLLHEPLTLRLVLGGGLLLAALVISQLGPETQPAPADGCPQA